MAKTARSPKLKVFQASLGFFDTVVAVPSQVAALRAWGTTQNLFKDGGARPTEDARAIEAALAEPGVVLRRPVGTNDPFSLKPGMPKIPNLPSRTRGGRAAAKEPSRKPADRKALDRAEADLAHLEDKHRAEQDAFAARRRDLEAEEAKATARYEEARDRARGRRDREQQAYVAAGGRLEE